MGDQDTVIEPPNGPIDPKRVALLEKQQYRIVGKHSAVKICHWTKQSLRDVNDCYKKKFYDIDCHKCAEISPSVMWCSNRCGFCWRTMEYYKPGSAPEADKPEIIIEGFLKERKKLLEGFGGNEKTNKKKLEDSYTPNHWAISLSGEPLLYPKLGEMIKILKTKYKARSIFVVSNGQEPQAIQRLIDQDGLPTQLYISMNAPNEETYKPVNKPIHKNYWERYLKSLDLMKQVKKECRTVLRMTLIKGKNMCNPKEYTELFKKADPNYIEAKGYMHLGLSQNRMERESMPNIEDIRAFSKELIKAWPELKIIDEMIESRIVLIGKKDMPNRKILRDTPEFN